MPYRFSLYFVSVFIAISSFGDCSWLQVIICNYASVILPNYRQYHCRINFHFVSLILMGKWKWMSPINMSKGALPWWSTKPSTRNGEVTWIFAIKRFQLKYPGKSDEGPLFNDILIQKIQLKYCVCFALFLINWD